ncbi:ABC transporter ATP-binding protein [Protaetiibacter intestinalis]|uniref:ABC transporter ATP-binding protein n=1 Tax=Protaetiibacter intestinalis TaxID=2419774 RepID=A0A387B3U8_9MICO|nr:ABC transporter ATP-binding protein [Protaetiibacter intestinalis]AYF96987.1 ABC transporter ATP-binding protein [Protaetiibacter intestinalis]
MSEVGTGEVVLRADGLSRSYGAGETAVHALVDASLTLGSGELVIVRGASGSGKTTLLNLLGGLDTADAGRVRLGDTELTTASEAELVEVRRRRISYVFQSFALLPALSAAENVEIPLRLLAVPAAERDARVRELLELVGLAGHAEQRPAELSGGQQQRVALARALANRPELLIADEPTGQLDSRTAEAMMTLIAALVHEQGVAAILTTHDPRMVAAADRLLEMHDGHLTEIPLERGRHRARAETSTGADASR